MGNKFSYDSSCDFSKLDINSCVDKSLCSPPSYVFAEKPVEQFSMKSDLEGIRKNLKNVAKNEKYPIELRNKADSESERVSNILNKNFIDKEDLTFEQVPTYEDVEIHLKKEGINPERYYSDEHIPHAVYDEGVPSPVEEQYLIQDRIREDIRDGKIQLDTPILTQIDPVTGEKKVSYWDKIKRWVRI